MIEVNLVSLPVLAIMTAIEVILTGCDNQELHNRKDMVYNLIMGLTLVSFGLLFKGVALGFFVWIHNYRLIELYQSWFTWLIAMFACDLIYYLFHWLGHACSIFWASHSTHHSSEYYNYTTAVRNHFIHLSYRFLFWSPLCLIGFNPYMVLFIDNCTNLYQFLLHTKSVGKLGPLEWILNTPSHHRVHHASNSQYIDKNFGGFFIIYDRLFGTFREEKETPVFGLTKNKPTGSVFRVQSYEFICLFKQIKNTRSVYQVLKILFSNPTQKNSQPLPNKRHS